MGCCAVPQSPQPQRGLPRHHRLRRALPHSPQPLRTLRLHRSLSKTLQSLSQLQCAMMVTTRLAVICCSAAVSGPNVLERMSRMILLFSHRSARHRKAGSFGSRRRCYVEQRAAIRPLRTLLLSLRYPTSSIYFRNPWEQRSILPPCLHHPPGQCPCSATSLIRQTSDKSTISPPS